jgi:hypothetical protein
MRTQEHAVRESVHAVDADHDRDNKPSTMTSTEHWYVEPTDWRFLNARFGRCALCHTTFQDGDVILWHRRTSEMLHPRCCVSKYPHLADWMNTATRWQRRPR